MPEEIDKEIEENKNPSEEAVETEGENSSKKSPIKLITAIVLVISLLFFINLQSKIENQ